MSYNSQELIQQATPWSRRAVWWIVLTQGIIALALGIFVLVQPQQAGVRFVQVLGAYLAVSSILALNRFRSRNGEVVIEPGRWLYAGIALVAGLIAFLHPWITTIDAAAAATVLAIGAVLAGLIGLFGIFSSYGQVGIRWGAVIVNVLYLLFGFIIFYNNRNPGDTGPIQWAGYLATGAGVLLVLYSIWMYRGQSAAEATGAAGVGHEPVAAGEAEPLHKAEPLSDTAHAAPAEPKSAPAAPARPKVTTDKGASA